MTLGPAKPSNAPGSAIIISPLLAKLAIAPPIVGLVRTEIYKPPLLLSSAIAELVFTICIKDKTPSCILAPPPEPEIIIRGSFFSIALSIMMVNLSPTTEPILPPINPKSVTPMATDFPPNFPSPITTASSSPVVCSPFLSFSSYPGKSRGL